MSMSRLSKLSRLAVFMILALSASSVFAQELKLGYVDMQRAISETEDGRKAKANLKKIFDQKQKELDEQQEDVKKAIEDLDKKRTLLPPDKVREKEAELQGRVQKIQQTYLRHQQDLQAKEQEATGKIVERMQKILFKIATAENFTMIFDKSGGSLAYAKQSLDLTNDLIRRYNNGEGGDGASASAAPAKKK
jgi:outer membrane protein